MPLRRDALLQAVAGTHNRQDPGRRQALLFGAMCYSTVSRGAEIFRLTRADCARAAGGVRVTINWTKTGRPRTTKLVPDAAAGRYNIAAELAFHLRHSFPDDQPIWRHVEALPRPSLSQTRPMAPPVMYELVRAVFGPPTTWHSFRKGAASDAAVTGMPNEVVMALGTWANMDSLRAYIGEAVRTDPFLARARWEAVGAAEGSAAENQGTVAIAQ